MCHSQALGSSFAHATLKITDRGSRTLYLNLSQSFSPTVNSKKHQRASELCRLLEFGKAEVGWQYLEKMGQIERANRSCILVFYGEHCRLVKLLGGLSSTGKSMLDSPCEHEERWSPLCHCYPLPRATDENHRPSDLGFIFATVPMVKECWKVDSNCYHINFSPASEITRSQFLLCTSSFSIVNSHAYKTPVRCNLNEKQGTR